MANTPIVQRLSGSQAIEINQVLRNTYLLLSLTLLASAGSAWFAMVNNVPPVGIFTLIIGIFGLQFLTMALKNSPFGLLAIFAFTSFMGYTLGPILNFYIHSFNNGGQIVMTSLGATGMIFLGLSFYAIVSRKNYSYMGGFLTAAVFAAFALILLNFWLQLPMMMLAISSIICLISSAFILYMTSAIIHGGERNYIMAAITLYVSIFNLFVSLLNILSFFSGGSRN